MLKPKSGFRGKIKTLVLGVLLHQLRILFFLDFIQYFVWKLPLFSLVAMRSSHSQVFYIVDVLKKIQKIQRKKFTRISFLVKLQARGFLKNTRPKIRFKNAYHQKYKQQGVQGIQACALCVLTVNGEPTRQIQVQQKAQGLHIKTVYVQNCV